jgi:hypothetical protein
MRRAITPHDDDDGFITARPNSLVDGFVILYDGNEGGFDTEGGRYVVFCQPHGSMTNETNKARATKLLASPENWCDACARAKFGPVAMRVMTFDHEKSPEAKEREMRFWAERTRNSSEKQELFERMYGVKPDGYWD